MLRNPRLSIEERLARIERLSVELQQEAEALREDLHGAQPPQTQPALPAANGVRVPDMRFR